MDNSKILIIDDDVRNTFALSAVLKTRGYSCLSAVSAYEGLNLLQQQTEITAVLMDMMMPGMDGYEAIALIRQDRNLAGLPVIAVTAQAMAGDRERALRSGADAYVPKPVNIDVLLGYLSEYIKSR